MSEVRPGTYRHFKGALYAVHSVCRHTETMEVLVIYSSVKLPNELWARPLGMFQDSVQREGYSGPRFKRVYCETCQVAAPIWSDRCRLCFLAPFFVAVAWRLAAIIFAFLLLACLAMAVK